MGTGAIARTFARGLQHAGSGRLVAVGSRSANTAQAFGRDFGLNRCYGSYEELLKDDSVQAVYISTPHPFHAEWALKVIQAGKHILCEKPLAMNIKQAEEIFYAARIRGVFTAEAFMYRCHPQTARLVELVRDGAIGEVRMIRASFGFGGGDTYDLEHRLFKKSLGGGGILDVGCYTVSGSRLIAGAAVGKPFANPINVRGRGHLGATGVDEWASAVLQFDSGIIAQVSTAIRTTLDNVLDVYGSKGRLHVPDPWVADRENPVIGEIHLIREGDRKLIEVPNDKTSFTLEAEMVAAAIAAGQREPSPPAMTWEDSLGNMATLDAWREEVGIIYRQDDPASGPKFKWPPSSR